MTIRRALYDAGQSGSLPAVAVGRAATSIDGIGAAVAANTPRYGRVTGWCPLQEWTVVDAAGLNFWWGSTGFDRDGTTRMMCAWQNGPQRMYFWINDLPSNANADHFVDVTRAGGKADWLFGTADEDAQAAYEPRSAVCLPGCFVILCQVHRGAESDEANWTVEGMALCKYQHEANGTWTRGLIGDLPDRFTTVDRIPSHAGSFGNYFPTVAAQHPLLEAWLPFADWINDGTQDPPKVGGQLGLCKATRADVDSNWTFGDVVEITHFDTADPPGNNGEQYQSGYWIPFGVIVSKGDGDLRNKLEIWTPDDGFDNYETTAWTKLTLFGFNINDDGLGSVGFHAGGGTPYYGDVNRLIMGSDVNYSPIFDLVFASAIDFSIRPMWGAHFSDDSDSGWDCFRLQAPGPERQPYVAGWGFPQGSSNPNSRIVLVKGEYGAVVGRAQTDLGAANHPCFMYGSTAIVSLHRGTTGSVVAMSRPDIKTVRPLLVGPGGTNELVLDGTALANVSVFASNTASQITNGLHPEDGTALNAPGQGPIYNCIATSAGGRQIFTFDPTDGANVGNGRIIIPVYIFNYARHGLNIHVEVDDNVSATVEWNGQRVISHDNWVPLLITIDGSSLAASHAPTVTISTAPSGVFLLGLFCIQFDGYYIESQLSPYPVAISGTGADEQIEQRLSGTFGAAHTIAMACHIPWDAQDHIFGGQWVVVTLYADADNFVQIEYDADNLQVEFIPTISGAPGTTMTVTGVVLQRGDQLWLGWSFDGTDMRCFATIGSTEDGHPALATETQALDSPPTLVRLGASDFSEVNTYGVQQIAVDLDEAATDIDGFVTLLSSQEDSNPMPSPPTISSTTIGSLASSASSANVALTVAAGQSIVVAVHVRDTLNSTPPGQHTPSSVVWDPGGVAEALTPVREVENNSGADTFTGLYVLQNPTAKTSTVVATFGSNQSSIKVVGHIVDDMDSTAVDTSEDNNGAGTSITDAMNVATGTLCISAATTNSPDANYSVASGADGTEVYEEEWGTPAGEIWGSSHPSTTGGSVTMGAQHDGASGNWTLAMASFNGVESAGGRGPRNRPGRGWPARNFR